MEEEFTLKCPHQKTLDVIEEETLPDFVLKQVVRHVEAGKTTWHIDSVTGETQEFADFEENSRKIASSLYKRGMRKGDTAIYLTTQMLKLHTFFMGCWRANGTLRASYPEDTAETLAERVEESRAGWLLCDPATAPICLEVAEKMYWDVEVISTGEFEGCTLLSDLYDDDGSELPELVVTGSHPALVLCTSGTTGKSKGAVHTHRTVVHAINASMTMPFTEKPNLIVSKATHITGSIFPLTILCCGKTCITLSVLSKKNMFESVQNNKPGLIWGFPTFLLLLVNDPEAADYDFSSLEYAATGGAQITPAIEQSLAKLANCKALLNAYGLTEAVPLVSEINFDDSENVKFADVPPFSIGKVCPGVSMQIRDPETGKVLGPNEKGEICAKAQSMFTHYINNKEATDAAFIDGWFKTGDLGYYDENEFIFLVDRLKEIFKYWNNHISPSELEDVINQHSAVGEVCVIGVEDPEGGGFIPRAFVTLVQDCPVEEIIQFANDKLASYKHLRGGLYVVQELPKGKTGKIQRNLVSQLPLPESSDDPKPEPAADEPEPTDDPVESEETTTPVPPEEELPPAAEEEEENDGDDEEPLGGEDNSENNISVPVYDDEDDEEEVQEVEVQVEAQPVKEEEAEATTTEEVDMEIGDENVFDDPPNDPVEPQEEEEAKEDEAEKELTEELKAEQVIVKEDGEEEE